MTRVWVALMFGVWAVALAVKHVNDVSYLESVAMFGAGNAAFYYVAREIVR